MKNKIDFQYCEELDTYIEIEVSAKKPKNWYGRLNSPIVRKKIKRPKRKGSK